MSRSYVKKKNSYGIACCRYNLKTGEPEILLMKKRYTYAFFDFVFCKYKKNDNKRLSKLFNQMTYQEKIDILNMSFDKLWCNIRIKIPDPFLASSEWKNYILKKRKFETNFIIGDKGKKLRRLINDTISIDSIWEIPKGRQEKGEKPLNTAIREFKEETDIRIKKYKILIGIDPIKYSYTINKTTYENTYFVAVAKKFTWEPKINFKSYEQIVEVENLKWVSLNEAKYLNQNQPTYNRTFSAIKSAIKLFTKFHPS